MSKFLACLVLALLLASSFLLIGVPPRPSWISETTVFTGAIIGLLAPFIWLPWGPIHQLRNAIAWVTGLGISTFGWKKLMHLQFRVPLSFADRPASQLDGETLTWFYFGHSFTFACVVGILQVTGSILLFFRRTRLAGAILLFPVMLNILLINIFYQMNAGALLQSIVLTIGVMYVLGLYAPELLKTLFPPKVRSTAKTGARKWIAAAIAVVLPFLFVYGLSLHLPPQSPIYGRYNVEELTINGTKIPTGKNDSVLTKVYFDLDNVCVLEYNDQQHRLVARYNFTPKPTIHSVGIESEFTDKRRQLPFRAMIGPQDSCHLWLKGQLGGDLVTMSLRKIEN